MAIRSLCPELEEILNKMPSQADRNNYFFRMPFASSIYPDLTPGETLSLLHAINSSMAPSQRLPVEILVQIHDEVHRPNAIWADIRSTWTVAPVNGHHDNEDPQFWVPLINFGYTSPRSLPLAHACLDPSTMRYRIVNFMGFDHPRFMHPNDPRFRETIYNMYYHMSSADLLYRARCFFPEVNIDPSDGYKGIWTAGVRHNKTGFGLAFSEYKGGATLALDLNPGDDKMYHFRVEKPSEEYIEQLNAFTEDSIKLLNTFFQTIDTDDGPQLAFFHPAARANIRPSSEFRYVAVPEEGTRSRIQGDTTAYKPWALACVTAANVPSNSSHLRSILPDLKYDVKSRKIDPVNGTTPLTHVISSALLFYRLLCRYRKGSSKPPIHGNVTVQDNNGVGAPMTSSVWQLGFYHKSNPNAQLLFMDVHGLFDIRASEDAMNVMPDIVRMCNSLCGDNCAHPYDGTVAGCVA